MTGKCSERRVNEFTTSLVCLLTYGKVSPLSTTVSGQQPAYSCLFHMIRENLYSSGISDYHTLSTVMDQPKASVSGCADLHCITSVVALPSLLSKAVLHSSPGNYLSTAWKSKNRSSGMLISSTLVQLKRSIFLGVLSHHHSLCSAPKPSSSKPYLHPHASLKLTGQLWDLPVCTQQTRINSQG